MKTRIILAVAVVLILAIALTSGASNMGFKLSQSLAAGGTKYIALPYYNSYAVQTAQLLRNDAGGAGITLYNWNGTVWQRYAGGTSGGQVNFALEAGTGYQVYSTNANTNWVIVGSHNPSTSISIAAGATKYLAVPYHTTCTTAQLLRNELGGAGITLYNWNGSVWQRYAGGTSGGQVNFTITPGLAYQVYTTNAINNYVPSHY